MAEAPIAPHAKQAANKLRVVTMIYKQASSWRFKLMDTAYCASTFLRFSQRLVILESNSVLVHELLISFDVGTATLTSTIGAVARLHSANIAGFFSHFHECRQSTRIVAPAPPPEAQSTRTVLFPLSNVHQSAMAGKSTKE